LFRGEIGRAKCWLVKLVGWLVVVVDGIPRKDRNRSLSKVGKGMMKEWLLIVVVAFCFCCVLKARSQVDYYKVRTDQSQLILEVSMLSSHQPSPLGINWLDSIRVC